MKLLTNLFKKVEEVEYLIIEAPSLAVIPKGSKILFGSVNSYPRYYFASTNLVQGTTLVGKAKAKSEISALLNFKLRESNRNASLVCLNN